MHLAPSRLLSTRCCSVHSPRERSNGLAEEHPSHSRLEEQYLEHGSVLEMQTSVSRLNQPTLRSSMGTNFRSRLRVHLQRKVTP